MEFMFERTPFGTTKSGEQVMQYSLAGENLRASVLDYGAIIRSLRVKDRTGAWVDVVLGYDSFAEYEESDGYFGACIGRVGNRIGGASFSLGGKNYTLCKNDGENHLHGGVKGFDKYVWQAQPLSDGVRFSRVSKDGEEGYPGTMTVSVSYRIQGSTFIMEYEAGTDADTLCSLTNHSYFNLNGGGSVLRHRLQIHADTFLENDAGCLPTGKILCVEDTPFDFRTGAEIGRGLMQKHPQLENCGGYDHNFCLGKSGILREAAVLQGENGVTMTLSTTMPGMQIYSANFLTDRRGKGGMQYHKNDALCLETQYYPNAMACDGFEKPILRAGESVRHITRLSFSVK